MELQEVALKEMKDMSTDDILFMFRMNKAMMGITDNVNKATSNDAFVFMAENIIKPDWDRFIDQINQFVLNLWKKDEYIKYKKPTLKSDAEKLEEDKALIDKAKTRNEIRQERGLEPVPGGDFLYVAINQVPIGVAPNGSKMLKKKV
jgi:capsid portal protein